MKSCSVYTDSILAMKDNITGPFKTFETKCIMKRRHLVRMLMQNVKWDEALNLSDNHKVIFTYGFGDGP